MYKLGECNANETKAYLIINHYKVSYIKDMGRKYKDELCTRVRKEFTILQSFQSSLQTQTKFEQSDQK